MTVVKTPHKLWCCVSLVREGDLGDEVDGMKGDTIMGWQAQKMRTLWFSQDGRSQLCQRVLFIA